MSWSDEFFNGLTSGKDPPQQRKSKIKKLIREELNKNPVDMAMTWRNTKQGHEYWRKINDLVINELSK